MAMRKIEPKSRKEQYGDSPMKESAKKDIYPEFHLPHETVPEAKKMEVGKKYHIHMQVKKTGHNESRFQNSSDFEIHAIDTGGAGHGPGEKLAEKIGDEK